MPALLNTTMAGQEIRGGARAAIAGQLAVAEWKGVIAGHHEAGAALAKGLLWTSKQLHVQ